MSTNIRWFPLVLGLLFAGSAIFMFATPGLQLAALGFFISLLILGSGIVSLIGYFTTPAPVRSGWDLANAIITLLLGVVLMGNTAAEQAALVPTVIGIWLIVDAILRLMVGQRAKYLDYRAGKSIQWTAWLPLILGVLMVIFPLFFGTVGVWLVAFGFLAFGVFNLVIFASSLGSKKNSSQSPSEIIDL
ncbi:MAG: DUF308 domain-containing protein [Rothia sp. (in: high G+C Gram-positive bacteria)]|uniref:HdeD family acid-resistance protein n=1 Tax=Rothia sp. (in: high G+C Gram-positive bacteria) TaxID=1885016 RepID=UPI0026E0AD1D|nr:DUF308 domain-containing protein [Rothia sp. (in: high G+C Gram-positive bacteria)]MDO5750919.1 DUF308 domain-containing protein [Rothia sp. (in: high G+C Gram-positive bacteria)]